MCRISADPKLSGRLVEAQSPRRSSQKWSVPYTLFPSYPWHCLGWWLHNLPSKIHALPGISECDLTWRCDR